MANFNPLSSSGRILASTKAVGVCQFDGDDFVVNQQGVVSLHGTGALQTLSGDSGGDRPPTDGNIEILGGTNITTAGASSAITVNLDAVLAGLTSVAATTYTTNVAAAQASLSGTTLSAIGTDANINLTLTPKGTGDLLLTVGDLLASAGDIIASRSAAGADVTHEVTNSDNASGSSNAFFEAAVGGTSSGDAGVRFQISGGQNWSVGLDNSDSDAWVLSEGNSLGTTNALRIAPTTRDVSIATGNLAISTTGKQLQVKGGAATDFIGTAVLTAGTVTIPNTNVAAGDRIFIQRIAAGASTTLGELSYTISAGVSFTVTSLIIGTPGSTETGDTSSFAYFIVRQV